MEILTIDVGGTHVKVLATGRTEPRKIDSGPSLTAAAMVALVRQLTADWTYDVVSIGYPGPVVHGAPVKEPANLGAGWVGFDFQAAFGKPVRVINDAAMQALGSYAGGRMLFLGLGTGLGSAMVVNGLVEPMELAHLPYKRHRTYEDYVGLRGIKRLGKKEWRREVAQIIQELEGALQPEYIVLGGGNARLLKELPPGVRLGDNANAFEGGFRLWQARPGVLPAPPRDTGERRVFKERRALAEAAAGVFFDSARAAVEARGRFHVALSGGSTPLELFRMLASEEPWRSGVPWEHTHVFWSDERHVPPDHPESNFGAAQASLLSTVPVPPEQVHRVPAEMNDAALVAAAYEAELVRVFGTTDDLPRFDLLMLGLGPDGHTASLFPGTLALHEHERLVVSNWVGKFNTNRITLTTRVLNNAGRVVFLVAGEDKAPVLKAVFDGPHEPDQLPAQLISPRAGSLLWLLDSAAASLL